MITVSKRSTWVASRWLCCSMCPFIDASSSWGLDSPQSDPDEEEAHRRNYPTSAVRRNGWNYLFLGCSDEPVLVRVGCGRGARGQAQLGEDVAHVPVDRPLAKNQLGGDRLIGLAGGDQAQHLMLTRRQPMSIDWRSSAGELADSGEIRRSSKVCEVAAGRFKLQRGGVIVAGGAAGHPQKHTYARGLIWHFEFLPYLPRVTQRDQGIPNFAVGQVDRSPGVRSHRTKHATLKTCRELREISAGAASLLDLAYGQHDLDVGRKETYALRRLGGLAHSAADRGARGRCVRLGQAQQGQTRQRLPPAAAGVPVGCFGSGELPPQTVDLTLPVAGTSDRSPIHRPSGTLAGPPRLLDRVKPRTVKLYDLGAMYQARACECHHVWLLLAPSREGGRPLLCAAQLVRVLAAQDHAAIDQTADDRRQLPRSDRYHRLIQQSETLLDTPVFDQEDALRLYGQGEQIIIAKTLADLGGFGRDSSSGLVVTGSLLLKHERQLQIALLHALTSLAFDQPLRAAQPSCPTAHLSPDGQMHAHPERAARGTQRLASIKVDVIGTLHDAHVVATAEHVSRRRQQFEILRSERNRLIGA